MLLLCSVSEDQTLPEHRRQDPGHQPQAAHASYPLLHSPVIPLEDTKMDCFPAFSLHSIQQLFVFARLGSESLISLNRNLISLQATVYY